MAQLSVTTITAAIAAMSVAGVNIKDLSALPEECFDRDCPLVYPKPDNLITGLDIDAKAFGKPSVSQKVAQYVLTYTFLHSEVASERGLFARYPDFVAKLLAFLHAVTTNDALSSGTLRVKVPSNPVFGVAQDPTGKKFHGSYISLHVMESLRP